MTLFKFGTSILLLYLAGCTTSGAYRPPPVPEKKKKRGQIYYLENKSVPFLLLSPNEPAFERN